MIEAIDSLATTTPSDPTTFAFFKGLNAAAVGGVLTATVTGGLPVGTYKVLFLPLNDFDRLFIDRLVLPQTDVFNQHSF